MERVRAAGRVGGSMRRARARVGYLGSALVEYDEILEVADAEVGPVDDGEVVAGWQLRVLGRPLVVDGREVDALLGVGQVAVRAAVDSHLAAVPSHLPGLLHGGRDRAVEEGKRVQPCDVALLLVRQRHEVRGRRRAEAVLPGHRVHGRSVRRIAELRLEEHRRGFGGGGCGCGCGRGLRLECASSLLRLVLLHVVLVGCGVLLALLRSRRLAAAVVLGVHEHFPAVMRVVVVPVVVIVLLERSGGVAHAQRGQVGVGEEQQRHHEDVQQHRHPRDGGAPAALCDQAQAAALALPAPLGALGALQRRRVQQAALLQTEEGLSQGGGGRRGGGQGRGGERRSVVQGAGLEGSGSDGVGAAVGVIAIPVCGGG